MIGWPGLDRLLSFAHRQKSETMQSVVGRNLKLCFSKMKTTQPLTHKSPPTTSASSSTSPEDPTSSILMKNFNSLYDLYAFDPSEPEPADLATAFASQRFFFSSPGHSNSIVQSTPSSSSSSSPENPHPHRLFANSVAVPTLSPDPYVDFRSSMQEMVEARPDLMLMDLNSSWEMLHELLLCYLTLNPRNTHKFILRAFADLLLTLVSVPPHPEEDAAASSRGC